MAKIIDKNGTIIRQDDQYGIETVIDLLEDKGYGCEEWDCISDLVKTMTGNAATPFNTIGEMIKYIPEIINCNEECSILEVSGNDTKWFILGWNNEDNEIINNKILQTYFPDYTVIED